MRARSIQGASLGEIRSALVKCAGDNNDYTFKPTVAIAFISIQLDAKAICALLNESGIDVIAATSAGEFIELHESSGGAVILLLEIEKSSYSILFSEIGKDGVRSAANTLARKALVTFENPAFIICTTAQAADGKMVDGEELLRGLEEIAGTGVNIFGGMAGDDITFTGTFVFANNQSTDYGMAILVLDENKITLRGAAISGWKAVGITRIATKTEGNLIYTIDNQPALEMYMRFLGIDVSPLDSADFFDTVGIQYPFQIERENREPMMCNPVGYDKEKGALICESNVQQGARFRFSTPPDFDIVETVIESAQNIKDEAKLEAEALLVFSCAGRLNVLGPLAQQENEGLQKVWNVPMAGFYTYGEYGKGLNGKHEFHSTTCSWVILAEK